MKTICEAKVEHPSWKNTQSIVDNLVSMKIVKK